MTHQSLHKEDLIFILIFILICFYISQLQIIQQEYKFHLDLFKFINYLQFCNIYLHLNIFSLNVLQCYEIFFCCKHI